MRSEKILKVRIDKCTYSDYWYFGEDYIGKEYSCLKGINGYYPIGMGDMENWILPKDCTIIDSEKSVWTIQSSHTKEFYCGVRGVGVVFSKNIKRAIPFDTKEIAQEYINTHNFLDDIRFVPFECVFIDPHITPISSDKPLNQDEVKMVDELADKADQHEAKQQLIRIMTAGMNEFYDELDNRIIAVMEFDDWKKKEVGIPPVAYWDKIGKIDRITMSAPLRSVTAYHTSYSWLIPVCFDFRHMDISSMTNEQKEKWRQYTVNIGDAILLNNAPIDAFIALSDAIIWYQSLKQKHTI